MNLANIEYQDKLRQYVLQMRPVFKPNALFSDETSNYVTPMEPDPGDIVTIRFRTWKDNVDKVYLVSNDRHLAMEYEKSEGDFDYFKIRLVMQEESVRYFFEILNLHSPWVIRLHNNYFFKVTPYYLKACFNIFIRKHSKKRR